MINRLIEGTEHCTRCKSDLVLRTVYNQDETILKISVICKECNRHTTYYIPKYLVGERMNKGSIAIILKEGC